ncbi:hypothetical protein Thermo_01652 [Thermoplasmatales archaeon]|nr:hypothetical protein Thermo_01652 [Thermoplasmatales archaeon]
MPQLLEVTHISKRGASMRITLPKKAAECINAVAGDIIGFYEEDGKVFLKKMK